MKVASAFMIDVQQIALALRACTKRSLVVIDEFGKGTESQGLFPLHSVDVEMGLACSVPY